MRISDWSSDVCSSDLHNSPGAGVLDTDFPVESKFDHLPEQMSAAPGPVGLLAIQEGCDKFCTFCVVPYTRGAEYSRPRSEERSVGKEGVRTRSSRWSP